MKREIEKEVRLPAFSLETGELELLWKRIHELFDAKNPIRGSISLSKPNERLEFDTIDELKTYDGIRGRVTTFSLRVSQGRSSVSIKSGGLFSNVPTLKIEGESDIWCAGAQEVVSLVVNQNRMWYWWLVRLPLNLTFFVVAMLPYAVDWLFNKKVRIEGPALAAWASVAFTLAFIVFTREKLLPSAALVFTPEQGFIRRYGSELGLALGVLSFVAAILMWLYPRAS